VKVTGIAILALQDDHARLENVYIAEHERYTTGNPFVAAEIHVPLINNAPDSVGLCELL
jgi:hypothetical protein